MRRLLVVDDEVHVLAALRRALRREGYEILTAEGPEAGLRRLAEGPVDAVLCDHKMPGMSGVELLTRAAELCPGAGRILISGWPDEVPEERLRTLGIHALLSKPWQDSVLKRAVRGAMGLA